MQIIINIPEELYEAYKGRPPMLGDAGMDTIAQAISNGTPLPKGHGRLVDAGKLLDTDRIIVDNSGCHYIPMINVYEAPTIIEADKEHEIEKHSCSKCRYLGWENVGEGMNPVCEQELYTDVDKETGKLIGLYKSEPTIGDKNDCCYWRAKEVKE